MTITIRGDSGFSCPAAFGHIIAEGVRVDILLSAKAFRITPLAFHWSTTANRV